MSSVSINIPPPRKRPPFGGDILKPDLHPIDQAYSTSAPFDNTDFIEARKTLPANLFLRGMSCLDFERARTIKDEVSLSYCVYQKMQWRFIHNDVPYTIETEHFIGGEEWDESVYFDQRGEYEIKCFAPDMETIIFQLRIGELLLRKVSHDIQIMLNGSNAEPHGASLVVTKMIANALIVEGTSEEPKLTTWGIDERGIPAHEPIDFAASLDLDETARRFGTASKIHQGNAHRQGGSFVTVFGAFKDHVEAVVRAYLEKRDGTAETAINQGANKVIENPGRDKVVSGDFGEPIASQTEQILTTDSDVTADPSADFNSPVSPQEGAASAPAEKRKMGRPKKPDSEKLVRVDGTLSLFKDQHDEMTKALERGDVKTPQEWVRNQIAIASKCRKCDIS